MQKAEFKEVKLDDIIISKTNPRKHWDEESVIELSASIREKGVVQPIVIRPNGKPGKFELVCGERRYRASLLVRAAIKDRDTIPSIIRELSDNEALELQIIENLQRKDIHPMDEAVSFKALIDLKKFNEQEIATRLGKSINYVAQRLKLNELYPEFQKAFYQDRLKLTSALKICKLSHADQKEMWNEDYKDTNGELDIDQWTLNKYTNDLNQAPFDIKDATIKKEMGACTTCQFNSAGAGVLWLNETGKATCMNSKCFQSKCSIAFNLNLKQALETPEIVLITGGYGDISAEATKLAKGGKIYKYNEYVEIEKPQMPDPEEDFDIDDYESEKERKKDIDDAMKDYNKDVAEYEKKVASGKFIKAFVLQGNSKGHFVFVELKKDAKGKTTAAGVKQKEAEGKLTREDIKTEIQRVKDAEKRKKEIDAEKLYIVTYEILAKSKFVNDSSLTKEELAAAILLICEKERECDNICRKKYKIKTHNYQDHRLALYQKLIEEKIDILSSLLFQLLRAGILHAFRPSQQLQGQRPDSHGDCAAIETLAMMYDPIKYGQARSTQNAEALKRKERVSKRLEDLEKQLKEFGTKEKSITTTKAATKS